jgi:hypothetical protein
MDYHVVSHVIWPWCGDSAGRTWNLPGQQWAKKTHSAQVAQYASGSIKSKIEVNSQVAGTIWKSPPVFCPRRNVMLTELLQSWKMSPGIGRLEMTARIFLPAAWQVHDAVVFSNIRWQDHMLGNKNDYLPGHPIHLHGYVQYIPMMFGIAFMMVGWSYTMTIAWKLTMAYNISSQIPWYAIIVITYPIVSRPIITICHSSFFITMV